MFPRTARKDHYRKAASGSDYTVKAFKDYNTELEINFSRLAFMFISVLNKRQMAVILLLVMNGDL